MNYWDGTPALGGRDLVREGESNNTSCSKHHFCSSGDLTCKGEATVCQAAFSLLRGPSSSQHIDVPLARQFIPNYPSCHNLCCCISLNYHVNGPLSDLILQLRAARCGDPLGGWIPLLRRVVALPGGHLSGPYGDRSSGSSLLSLCRQHHPKPCVVANIEVRLSFPLSKSPTNILTAIVSYHRSVTVTIMDC